jgi:UDP-N-acetylmuramoyl-tripeptide--D-alanyl-D-alanine ligase
MILKNLIYILQSENYDYARFLKFAYTHPLWWKLEKRQQIVWTVKASVLWIITVILFWSALIVPIFIFTLHWLFILPIFIIILPILLCVALFVMMPCDIILKNKRRSTAKRIIMQSDLITIGITGSYGKTSTKEILTTILAEKYTVLKTPENINTDIGIADFIIKNKDNLKKYDVFVIEMGAHHIGEIATICHMVQPQYSILTGINQSHIERFGSIEKIIQTKFELPQNTSTLSLLNVDDTIIKQNIPHFPLKNTFTVSCAEAHAICAKENFGGWTFLWNDMPFHTILLADHNITLILLCLHLAQKLSLSCEEMQRGVSKIKHIPHRLQPIYNATTDIMVIDDSYNGNINGIRSGIAVLGRASGRKVVLTPGLVELGSYAKTVHNTIGDLYAKNVDLVLLIKNTATQYVIDSLQKNGFTNYKIYPTTQAAHDDLQNILRRGDTIIFQNDLTDNYF